jgi:hypothetical protein
MPGGAPDRLASQLSSLSPLRRPGTFTLVAGSQGFAESEIEALVREDEGLSVVVPVASAARAGRPIEFRAAWLTLGVQSDVADVGLTAAVASALAAAAIPCNVLAGLRHDHLLVPETDADRALSILQALAAAPPA